MITAVTLHSALSAATLIIALIWIATARTRRSRPRPEIQLIDPVRYGLVPTAQLEPGRAGPPPAALRLKEMQGIADAAWEGDWRQADAHVEAAGQDWDERWSRQDLLVEIACRDDEWLMQWREAQPGNCTAATVHARLLLHHAWEIRGNEYAHAVPAERMARFRELLPASFEAARRAALLSSEDPGPWVVMITAARALRYTHEQFRPLWEELTARAPHHYQGHGQALQYWCAKWCGSNRAMLAFAERAVRSAPPGSPLAAVHLQALREIEIRSGAAAVPSTSAAKELLVDVARSLAQASDAVDEEPQLRHVLAHYLGRAGLHDAALEQFRLIGPWCGAQPWASQDDPAAAFDLARRTAAFHATGVRPTP